MIFNVVVDVFICHWLTVVEATETGTEGLGVSIQDLVAYIMQTEDSSC